MEFERALVSTVAEVVTQGPDVDGTEREMTNAEIMQTNSINVETIMAIKDDWAYWA